MDRQEAIRKVRQYLFRQDWKVERGHYRDCDVTARRGGRLLLVEVRVALDNHSRERTMNQLKVLALVGAEGGIRWRLYEEETFADSIEEALNVRKR